MLTKWMIRAASCVALSLVSVAFVGCRKEAAEPAPAASTEVVDPAIEAILAKADLVDGKADHVVSKCGGCKLGMDGIREHAIKAADYKLLFCSVDCKDKFSEDTNKSILALRIPED